MPKVAANISTSLDGYVAGPNDGPDNGLGDGGERLHQWVYGLESWRERHGLEGGETSADAEVLEETFATTGAIVLGKRMFDNARGWGEEPPFHMPVFVLTHHAREPLEMQGGTTFHFVTEGTDVALERARDAARGKDVTLGGGANIAQQYLKAGLIDEMEIHVVPVLLGEGARLFDNTNQRQTAYECVRVVNSPTVSHYKYRRRQSSGTD
jgi:dihydrofolate reductase